MRGLALLLSLSSGVAFAAQDTTDLATLLQRAGERVEHYFTRAQSIVCLEIVQWLPLNSSFGVTSVGRTMESELRLSWAPGEDGAASTEAQTLRQLLRVNGREPRKNDWRNCTDPEQQMTEPHSLSILLPAMRTEYEFKLAGRTRLDDRNALIIDYRSVKKAAVTSSAVEGRDDCISYEVDGGMRGRLWIDTETHDVLRLDEALIGMVEIPLPKKVSLPFGAPHYWTAERMDRTIRFKAVAFTNPDETLILPASMSEMRITRGSGTPRLRTMTDYTAYRRFLTGGRVIPPSLQQ
jgi:hypothetical protein